MTSSHAGTPQARAKIHTTLTDFEIALVIALEFYRNSFE